MLTKSDLIFPLRHDVLLARVGEGEVRWFRINDQKRLDVLHAPGAAVYLPSCVEDLLVIYYGANRDCIIEEMRKVSGLAVNYKVFDNNVTPWAALWRRIRQIPMTGGTSLGAIPKTALNAKPLMIRAPKMSKVAEQKLRSALTGKNAVKHFDILYQPNQIQARDLAYLSLPRRLRGILSDLRRWIEQNSPVAKRMTRAQVWSVLVPASGERGDFDYFILQKSSLKDKKLIAYE